MPTFDGIQLFGFGPGTLTLSGAEMKWVSRDQSEMIKKPMKDVVGAQWTLYGRRGLLRLLWSDDTVDRLEGFSADDRTELEAILQKAEGDDGAVDIENVKPNVEGTNFGDVAFEGKRLLFERDRALVFEKDLGSMTQCVIPGNRAGHNEVEMQFLESDAVATADDTLVEIRFVMPEADEDMPETPAEELQKLAIDAAGIRNTGGAAICSFEGCSLLVPRGSYSMHLYETFVRMTGAKYDYRIKYGDINRLYMLEKPDGYRMVVVISLARGIRQGQQRYQNLVLETNKDEEEVTVNLTEEECAERYNNALLPSTVGPLCNLIAMAFRHIAGKKIFVAGSYRSARDLQCLQCAHKTNTGLLFVLDRSFVFIHKPTLIVRFNELQSVELQKGDAKMGLRTFDMTLTLKAAPGADRERVISFSQLEKDEYRPLLLFLQKQKVRIKNLHQEGAHDDLGDDDEEDEAERRRRMMADGLDDDESEDEDFNPDEKNSDEDSESSDGEDDDDFEDEEDLPKRRKKAKAKAPAARRKRGDDGDDDEDAAKNKKRKRKDPHAPKKAMSAFMFFSNAKREEIKKANPEFSITDISKEAGRLWREMTDDEKKPYQAQADADKERYAKAMESYEPPEASDDDGEEEETGGKKKRAKAKKDPDAPKKNLTAFFHFQAAKREQVKADNPEMKIADIGREMGRLWGAMTDAEKAPFQAKAEEDKARYKREMEEYDGGGGGAAAKESPAKKKPTASRSTKVKREKTEEEEDAMLPDEEDEFEDGDSDSDSGGDGDDSDDE
eukprot:CAMPEP_0118863380 /NCGR_PEP_ID=MMETSP1163-20130328/8271_1 /TAXON_ID=124430 /ORGANISM="Phaeomonas parva, Strain CCMP2877" /LENGTH=781 /DNA_ID=CAMNT_0006797381 /DNA_START=105 /DNA_END=2450 /DNA_ORIENTATION=+